MQKLQGELPEETRHAKLDVVRRLVQDISGSGDVSRVLEELYQIVGYERFALGLMWVMSSPRSILNSESEELLEYDVEALSGFLGIRISNHVRSSDTLKLPPSSSIQSLNEQMDRFGRFITNMKQRLTVGGKFQGFEEDLIYRLMHEVSAVRHQAVREGKSDVERFCKAFARFLEFVIHDRLVNDPRVLSLMEIANITMQTVSATIGTERGDSLERTIDLLERPKKLFA